MAKSVLIIVGHWNIPNLTSEGLRAWRDVNTLKAGTGATNEMVFHKDQWMPKLRDLLIKKGIQVFVTDSIYHKDVYSRDYDLAILGHYDGGNTENRCMASAPLATMNPPFISKDAQKKSEQFAGIWRTTYPKYTGMINRNERITDGMTQNYAYDFINDNTPSVLVEHLNIGSPEGNKLVGTPDKVVEGDARSICEFFGIPWEVNPPVDSCEAVKKELASVKAQLVTANNEIARLNNKAKSAKAKVDSASADLS